MNQTMKKQNGQSTVIRLFGQLKGQRVRLTVVAVSIIIYVGLSIYNPMYSALVSDHLWQSIQAAWNEGIPFSISWTNMGRELTQLTLQYSFTWIFYYLQSYLMANVIHGCLAAQWRKISPIVSRMPPVRKSWRRPGQPRWTISFGPCPRAMIRYWITKRQIYLPVSGS